MESYATVAGLMPFDFCLAMRTVCEDITDRMADFRHIRMPEVAISFAQARLRVSHGLQAKLTPMRFERGALESTVRGQRWTVQRLVVDGREILYVLTFYLPRFLDHDFREKLVTIFHELYHVSPAFDGDIRRFPGRHHVHTGSQREYDRLMEEYADAYLRKRPSRRKLAFLNETFESLRRQHGEVVGLQIPIPKLLPISKSA